MIKTNRREFLKIGALGLGSLVATQGMNYAGSPEFFRRNGIKRLPTYCEVCFWKCAGWAYYDKKGDPYKVVGTENDPLCNGRLCPRGSAGLGMYNDPDRLRMPLIRDVKDGVQYWKEASWQPGIARGAIPLWPWIPASIWSRSSIDSFTLTAFASSAWDFRPHRSSTTVRPF